MLINIKEIGKLCMDFIKYKKYYRRDVDYDRIRQDTKIESS